MAIKKTNSSSSSKNLEWLEQDRSLSLSHVRCKKARTLTVGPWGQGPSPFCLAILPASVSALSICLGWLTTTSHLASREKGLLSSSSKEGRSGAHHFYSLPLARMWPGDHAELQGRVGNGVFMLDGHVPGNNMGFC